MKITNFLALGICLLFGSCTMQKSTVQVNDKGTDTGHRTKRIKRYIE